MHTFRELRALMLGYEAADTTTKAKILKLVPELEELVNTATSTNTLIIYHFNCVDGLGAAWAALKALPTAELYSASYNRAPPLDKAKDKHVVIVDFSYPLTDLIQLSDVAKSVIVLDHHDTARQALQSISDTNPTPANWPEWIAMLDDGNTGLQQHNSAALFDDKRSGAGITWDFFHPNTPRPHIINLIEDRDLWHFYHDPSTRAFHAVVKSHNIIDHYDMFTKFDLWDRLSVEDPIAFDGLISQGLAIVRYEMQMIVNLIETSTRKMTLFEKVVPAANLPGAWASEAGNMLLEMFPDAPFAVVYYDDKRGDRHYSLRSSDKPAERPRVHVGELARLYGGGGHANAAAFKLTPAAGAPAAS